MIFALILAALAVAAVAVAAFIAFVVIAYAGASSLNATEERRAARLTATPFQHNLSSFEATRRDRLYCGSRAMATTDTADGLLARARALAPAALDGARSALGFPGRWKAIAGKLERVTPCLSDLSSHPCFSKNALCRELLASAAAALEDAVALAARCQEPPASGKLRMQSDIDALSGRLDLVLRDCALLIKTGVLTDAVSPSPAGATSTSVSSPQMDVRELLARLQIGLPEAKHRAVDGLLDALREDSKGVLGLVGRSNISAIVGLLTATAPKVREKAATVVCLLAESGSCDALLVSEGVLPPLIRLAESGSLLGREKAVITLQRLSMLPDVARAIAGHGGVRPLIEVCQAGDSILQSAAAGALKNISAVPEVRQILAEEGIIRAMIGLLDSGVVLGSKEYAAECLQNLTASNDSLRRSVVSEGGHRSLLAYIDCPLPQEPAVAALRNLVTSVPTDSLVSLGILPRLVHVLQDGSVGAQQAAAVALCRISSSVEMKRMIGEFGFIPLLVGMLSAKSNGAREAAAQAVATLMACPQNARAIKKDERSVPSLVQLLDPSPQNTAKKYAIVCLLALSTSKRLKKLMVSHGAIGYLKKLSETDVAGAKKLLERLERGKLRRLFSRSK